MKGRALTRLTAIATLGIQDITTRIAELRSAGYTVRDEWAEDHHERRYKRYWMETGDGAPPPVA